MIEALSFVVFPFLLAFAAFSDLLTMTIPNRISFLLILIFFALAAYLPMPWGMLLDHVSCALIMLAITFALFQFGQIGGGDAKLASATALWLGWENVLDYGLVASIVGGALTLSVLIMRWYHIPGRLVAVPFISRLMVTTNGAPYGVALAIAGVLIYPQTVLWTRLSGL